MDLWENVCEFLDGKISGPLSRLYMENVRNLGVNINFKLKCPLLAGKLMITHPGLNFSNVVVPLLPAGRYRLDIFMSEEKSGHIHGQSRGYFTVSDFRIWH